MRSVFLYVREFHNSLNDKDYCWTKEYETPYSPDCLSHQFQNILKSANLPEVRFHDLRHSHATFLLMQGVPLKVISELMGHSSTNITQDIYSHVLLQMQQQAADAVDDILNEKKRKRILAFILDP